MRIGSGVQSAPEVFGKRQNNTQSSELKELPNYLEEKTSFDRKA